MEIGSFIDLQLPKGQEFYNQTTNIARLNTGRQAIWHAIRITGCKTVWLPIYQCDSVRDTLIDKGINIKYYHTDNNWNPINLSPIADEAVLIVNYYGIMSHNRMKELARNFNNAIVDNCQGFFCAPVENAMNVYSCRKFVGVPDGAYVIGENAQLHTSEYPQGFSSDTAAFLLMRMEYGCEGKAYEARSINEHRIDSEKAMLMSPLTQSILCATDYDYIQKKRRENFDIACDFFADINQIDPLMYYDSSTIPMVYPLVVEDSGLIDRLFKAKHFQGHWWSYICDEQPENTFEHWLSKYVIPITIDQRYGRSELEYLNTIINKM